MNSDNILKKSSKEYFHKICVVGGGLTGAIMTLLLKKSDLFKSHEIGWIKPKVTESKDILSLIHI